MVGGCLACVDCCYFVFYNATDDDDDDDDGDDDDDPKTQHIVLARLNDPTIPIGDSVMNRRF